MKRSNYRVVLLSLLISTASFAVQATDSERHVTVDGMEVYLGIIPAEIIEGYSDMHGRKPENHHRYHVLVALFDSNSGERIANAEVKARVSPLGLVGHEKKLETMHQKEMISYGNYFKLPDPGQYRIEVRIKRPEQRGEYVVARFLYRRPRD